MSRPAYRAILFDLFGTLIHVDPSLLTELVIDGRRVRSTLGALGPLVDELVPGVDVGALARALMAVAVDLERERADTCVEQPSLERFRRALARLGLSSQDAREVAPILVRAHMRGIAAATCLPPEHMAVLERAERAGALAVVTNFDDTATAFEILDRHRILSHVQTVVVSEAVGLRKPHPALVRMALRDLGVDGAAALMVGDNVVEDVGAARAAGVDAAWVDARGTGVPADAPVPRYVLRALTEVMELLG